jgi:hypothetical protein
MGAPRLNHRGEVAASMLLRCSCLVLLGIAATLSLLSDGGASGTGEHEQRVVLGREEVSTGVDIAFVPPRPSRRSLRSQGPRRRLLKKGSKPGGEAGGSGAGKPKPSIHEDAVKAGAYTRPLLSSTSAVSGTI